MTQASSAEKQLEEFIGKFDRNGTDAGQSVDKRTDIWAFGCVLFEMLSGHRAFAGATITDTLAAILQREPDWGALPPQTPGGVLRLTKRCLEKDPQRRLRDIGDADLALDVVSATAPPNDYPRWKLWTATTAAAVAVTAVAVLVISRPRAAAPPPAAPVRFQIPAPVHERSFSPPATPSFTERPSRNFS